MGFIPDRHNRRRLCLFCLNESQRAVIAAKLANMPEGGIGANQYNSNYLNLDSSKVSQQQAADMFNVSRATVATVKAIEKAAKLAT